MAVLALWRWVLLRMLRNPAVGLLWLAILLGLPFLQTLRPLPTSSAAIEVARSWAFPAGLVGTCLGLATLSRGSAFLARLDPRTRWAGELGALVVAATYLQLPIAAGALLAGSAPSDLGRSVPAILTADLHLAGLALLLLFPALSSTLRTSLFLTAVWLLPALCAQDARLVRVTGLFDAGAVLRAPEPAGVLPTLAIALAFSLSAYLLRTSAPRTRPG